MVLQFGDSRQEFQQDRRGSSGNSRRERRVEILEDDNASLSSSQHSASMGIGFERNLDAPQVNTAPAGLPATCCLLLDLPVHLIHS